MLALHVYAAMRSPLRHPESDNNCRGFWQALLCCTACFILQRASAIRHPDGDNDCGGQITWRSGGVAMKACLLGGGAPLLEARPPCMVMDVGEAYAALPVLTLPAESLLWEISRLARSSTSS